MKKMKLIAFVAALVAALALYKFLEIVSRPEEIPMTTVIVAVQDIEKNTELTEELLAVQSVPVMALQNNAVRNMADAVGMVLSSDVLAGEQLVSGRLVRVGVEDVKSDTLAYVVKPGMRAITVNMGFANGLASMLKPGNRVDVVMNYIQLPEETAAAPETESFAMDPQDGIPAARVLLQNIEVLAVDAVLQKQGVTMDVGYQTVTLMVTPEQAVQLSYAEANGALRLLLRSQVDEELVPAAAETAETMQR